MSETDANGGLTADEARYFETQGESAIPADTGVEDQGEPAAEETSFDGGEQEEGLADGGRRRDTVPHGALHEERERRKRAEHAFRDLELRHVRLEERANAILRRLGGGDQEAAPEPVPDPDIDPIGYSKRLGEAVHHVGQTLQQMQHQEYQRAQAAQAQSLRQNVLAESRRSVEAVRGEIPDVDDAMTHLRDSYVTERRLFGLDDAQILNEINEYEAQIAAWALQNGRPPAAVLYDLARQRGYARRGQGAERIERIARGQAANRTLSGAGGGPSGSGAVSAQDLLAMSSDEFERFAARNPRKMRQLMGG